MYREREMHTYTYVHIYIYIYAIPREAGAVSGGGAMSHYDTTL